MSAERKRFMLFCYEAFYPGGGESDMVGVFDTEEDAREAAEKEAADYKQVLDMDTGKWIDIN